MTVGSRFALDQPAGSWTNSKTVLKLSPITTGEDFHLALKQITDSLPYDYGVRAAVRLSCVLIIIICRIMRTWAKETACWKTNILISHLLSTQGSERRECGLRVWTEGLETSGVPRKTRASGVLRVQHKRTLPAHNQGSRSVPAVSPVSFSSLPVRVACSWGIPLLILPGPGLLAVGAGAALMVNGGRTLLGKPN